MLIADTFTAQTNLTKFQISVLLCANKIWKRICQSQRNDELETPTQSPNKAKDPNQILLWDPNGYLIYQSPLQLCDNLTKPFTCMSYFNNLFLCDLVKIIIWQLTKIIIIIWQTYFVYFAETEKLLLKEL